MKRWGPGEETVDELIEGGNVARLASADIGVPGLLDRAMQQLESAQSLLHTDPATSYVVAYDAAKHGALALLAVQNLRPTAAGGHVAIEKVLTAQFKGVFSSFNRLRRRRNELEYPSSEEDFAGRDEAARAVEASRQMVEDARRLVSSGQLTTFGTG